MTPATRATNHWFHVCHTFQPHSTGECMLSAHVHASIADDVLCVLGMCTTLFAPEGV